MTSSVFLTSPAGERTEFGVIQEGVMVWRLAIPEGRTACLVTEDLPPDVHNLDAESDSASCFGRSEHWATPEVTYRRGVLTGPSLSLVQQTLDRVKISVIDNWEY